MRPVILIAVGLVLIICFNFCGQQENQHVMYYEADSLLQLTFELQSKISSSEIQRMHDFHEEINRDLVLLSPATSEDTSLLRYMELSDGLEQCMKACSQYHEEAFMLESSLQDIMQQIQSEKRDLKKIHAKLHFEIDNYEDLSARIDISMSTALSHAEIFYSLKPEINQIRDGLLHNPEPKP